MNSLQTVLLALALGDAPAVDPPCSDGPRCDANRLLEQAQAASSAAHRVKLSIAAYRLRLALFEEVGVIADLCAARYALETGLGAEDAPEPLQQVALTTAAEFAAQYETRLASCDDPPPTRVPLLDPRGASPPRFEGDELDIDPPTPPTPAHRRSRIAGAALVGLGVGLLGAGGYGLAGMSTAKRSGYALVNDAGDGPATPTQLARDAELRDDYAANSRLALGAGIAGGVAAIVGAALLGVSRRHKARSGRLSTIQPTGDGLVLTARF